MKQAIVDSFTVTAADTTAHALSSTPLWVSCFAVWAETGSGEIRIGSASRQNGFAPYDFRAQADLKPIYDLSQIYFKLANANDVLCVMYTIR